MKLTDLNKDWRHNTSFPYKLGLIEYQCKVKYLPLSGKNRNEYETKNLAEIHTPVFHFEFETMNTEKVIYQSHWIMAYSLAWFLTNYPDCSLEAMVRFAAKENGYAERISELNQKLHRGTQLSIF
jgi:hypothetical protein